jgi:hypothetical protein
VKEAKFSISDFKVKLKEFGNVSALRVIREEQEFSFPVN